MERTHGSTVAIIGGGLAGITGARSCLQEGLRPTVFEKSDCIGGHWSLSEETSGVFDSLTTNITFWETLYSDVPPLRKGPDDSLGEHASLYLTARQWRDYIDHIIKITPKLETCFQTSSLVTSVKQTGDAEGSYRVTWLQNGEEKDEDFDFVIIATGRHQQPKFIPVKGLSNFSGRILHSKEYRNPEQFTGQNVLVVGGALSGPECAGDLADTPPGQGPSAVTLSTRMMKHFVHKQNAGLAYTDFSQSGVSSLMMRSGVANALDEGLRLRSTMEETLSRNSDFNLPDPNDPGFVIPVNAKFLDAAKRADKLTVKVGEIAEVNEAGAVVFKDGSQGNFDAIIFATGYYLDLPFLDPSVQRQVFAPKESSIMELLDLYLFTWHDAVPGMAFLGLYYIAGSAMSLLEMQSLWIARAFASPDKMPSPIVIREGVQKWIQNRSDYFPIENTCKLAHEFAEQAGCPVDYSEYPELTKCLLTGPYIPQQFRMFGYGALEKWDAVYKEVLEMAGVDIERMKVTCEDIALLRKCVDGFARQGRVPKGLEKAVETLERELDAGQKT